MEILEKIFGGLSKIKIMKLFIFNPAFIFDLETVCLKAESKPKQTTKDLIVLQKIGLIKKKDTKNKAGKKVRGYILDTTFVYLPAFKDFLLQVLPFSNEEIVKKFERAGKVKAVAVSGVFLNNEDSRIDLLVVGDRFNKNILSKVIQEIESGLGREIKFTHLESKDFIYRMEVRDKLIRDMFDYSHRIIFDKMGIQP